MRKPVGKIVKVHGDAKYQSFQNELFIQLRPKQALPFGSTLKTGNLSFVKVELLNQTTLWLESNSVIEIFEYKHYDTTVVRLLKGNLKVKADLKKTLVVTPMAALYAFNNTFELAHNLEAKRSLVLSHWGKVRWGVWDNIRWRPADFLNYKNFSPLDEIKSVEFGSGYFSMITKYKPPTLGARISPLQFEILLNRGENFKKIKKQLKWYREVGNTLPHDGLDRHFNIEPNSLHSLFKEAFGKTRNRLAVKKPLLPQGIYVQKLNRYLPPSGGYVDFKTVNYISPRQKSDYDPNTATYTVKRRYGSVDLETGNYLPPEGKYLKDNGKILLKGKSNDQFKTKPVYEWGRVIYYDESA